MNLWLEKQQHLIDFTLASLARRKTKNIGLLIAYTLLVFVLASLTLFSNALRTEAQYVLAGSPEVILQRMVAGRHDLIPPGYLDKIGRIRGVQKTQGRLWGYYYDAVLNANYTFMARPASEIADGQIMVGETLARERGLAQQNTISFRSYAGELFTFEVAAVLSPDAELLSADLVLLSENDFRRFFAYPDEHYTDIALSVANPLEVRNIAAKLTATLPDSRPILREEVQRTYQSIFDWREGILLTVLAGVILAFVILSWEKASGLSAEEKREIGILKALGWDTGDVIRMKMWEGLLISLTAFGGGFLAAYVHVFHFGAKLFEPVLKGWSVLYPKFTLLPAVDGLQVATLFFFTVIPYTAAVLVPIWRAAITDPDTVMR